MNVFTYIILYGNMKSLKLNFLVMIIWSTVGCTSLMELRPAQTAKQYFYPKDKVFTVAQESAREIGLDIKEADSDRSYFLAERDVTSFSWGEVVGVYFHAQGPNNTTVTIESKRVLATNVTAKDFTAPLHERIAQKLSALPTDTEQVKDQFPTPVATKDTMPPKIVILFPNNNRGVKVTSKSAAINILGKVTDDSGIGQLLVNQVVTTLNPDGSFEANVLLHPRQKAILVIARDIYGNEAREIVNLNLEDGQDHLSVAALPLTFIKGKYYALIIAVQDYADDSVNDLEFPLRDAEHLRHVLTTKYTFEHSNVHFLKNPDRREIIQTLGILKSKLASEDNLLIFYAGHGYWDENLEQGFWLPRNASLKEEAEWFSNSTLKDYLRGIKTKHTLVISDACFSGGIFRSREAFAQPSQAVQETYKLSSRKAITSGALKMVPDKSVFVEYLLKRLKENSEPYVDTQTLFASIKSAVINNSPVHQTPLYGTIQQAGDEGGDFIFQHR